MLMTTFQREAVLEGSCGVWAHKKLIFIWLQDIDHKKQMVIKKCFYWRPVAQWSGGIRSPILKQPACAELRLQTWLSSFFIFCVCFFSSQTKAQSLSFPFSSSHMLEYLHRRTWNMCNRSNNMRCDPGVSGSLICRAPRRLPRGYSFNAASQSPMVQFKVYSCHWFYYFF